MKTEMDEVGVKLVNAVTNQGMFDGIININFATFLFTPTQARINDQGEQIIDIDPELVTSVRLRMGEQCLRQLHQATTYLVALIDEDKKKRNGEMPATSSEGVARAKAN